MKILMTGATGLIGSQLGLELFRKGHDIFVVSRDRKKAQLSLPFPAKVIEGDLSQGPLMDPELEKIEGVIHLMGESVAAKRWSSAQKVKIFDSRILGTRHLINSFKKAPPLFISASAIGFYGDRGDEVLTENSAVGSGFLSDVCSSWEKEVDDILDKGASRVVKCRIGVALSSQGGALEKMKPAFQAGVGGKLGSGRHWMSWIHINDAVGLFIKAVEDSQMSGVINFVSEEPVTNQVFSQKLAKNLRRPLGPAVPAFALKVLFGEMSQVLLASQKVLPEKARSIGYQFQYPTLDQALDDVLSAQKRGEEIFMAHQFLPLPKEKVFEFFSEAQNLERITPPSLKFHILDMSTPQIQKGTLINYKLKIEGIPVGWQTLIEKWDPPHEFVDSSLKGPYKLWHHTHRFESLGNGTLMTDVVRYQLPMGYLGWLAAHWKVKSDINKIFDFRRSQVAEIFGLG